jgi:DNA modification methylase
MSRLINGDCIEELKKLPDKSVDFFYHDLPYNFFGKSETNCHWDKPVNLELLWKELRRIAKHDRVAYVFSCSTKFGYELIKSNPKMFRMDLVWVKRNKTGGIYSRYRPMKNHEMVYFFYKKAPKYNRDKYHKRIKPVAKYNKTKNSTGGDITYGGTHPMDFRPKTFDPPNPASVLVLDDDKTETDKILPNSFKTDNVDYKKEQFGYRNSGFKDGGGARFNPKLPVSVIEKDKDKCLPKWDKGKKEYSGEGWDGGWKTGFGASYSPPNPVSVYEFTEDEYNEEPKTAFRSGKVFVGKRNHQTEKPLDLMEFLLKYWTDEGDVVVDSCMGSGTMGVQCKKMNRSFIGVEKNKKIYDVACRRVENGK